MSVTGTPQEQNVEIPRGDDRIIRIELEENGSVAGWTFTFAVRINRNEPDSVDPVISRTGSHGVNDFSVVEEGDENTPAIIDITVPNEETLALARRDYWWSCKRADDGFNTTLVHGVLSMTNTAAR